MKLADTPIEFHSIEGKEFFVKREDLACPPPGPCFSKVRGLFSHMEKLKRDGVTAVGYVETAISMAGIGVAWACKELEMQAIIYDPQYSNSHPARTTHEIHRLKWTELGATIIPLRPLMTKVNFNIAKKMIGTDSDRRLLPLGLPLQETIEETAEQMRKEDLSKFNTIVVCVGSGTICSGLLQGISLLRKRPTVLGIMCRDGQAVSKERSIRIRAGAERNSLYSVNFQLVNPGYKYIDGVEIKGLSFPCNKYYDRKALKFLLDNYNRLQKPILFWNIGGSYNDNNKSKS